MSGATENQDGSKKDWIHGPAISDAGEIRYLSVSQCEKADANGSPGTGCPRKWHFDKRNGIKEGPTPATERGDRCHGEYAYYLRTGDRSRLSSLPLSGLHNLPTPGPDLLVEFDIVPAMPDGSSGLHLARLRAAGIPFAGAIDLIHARPENPGVSEVTETTDPPGVLKIIDHKFPSGLDHAKAGHQLVETIQMSGYATWAFDVFPNVERIRVAHNIVPVRGSPRFATAVVDREAVSRTWKRVESLAVSMRDAAREQDSNKVDANTDACHAFHKDCPALKHCSARARHSLSSVIGRTAADRFLARSRQLPVITPGAPQNMPSLIDQLKAKSAAMSANPAAVAPAPAPVAAAPPTPSAVESEIARLNAQVAAVAIPPALVLGAPLVAPVPAPAPVVDPAAAAAVAYLDQITALGKGTPALGGELARLYAIAKGLPSAIGYAGSGELAQHTLSDPAVLPAALAQLTEYVAAQRKATEDAAAADAAKVQAAIAALPPAPSPVAIPVPAASPSALLPPDAPSSNPALASIKPEDEKANTKKGGKKGGTKKASPPAAEVQDPPASWTTPPTTAPVAAPAATTTAASTTNTDALKAIDLYVDCARDGLVAKSLWPVVLDVMAFMSLDSAAVDFRCADPNGKYGYARWKGVLAACLHEAVTTGDIAPGPHTFETDMMSSEIAAVVVETMRGIVASTGGVFVRGTR